MSALSMTSSRLEEIVDLLLQDLGKANLHAKFMLWVVIFSLLKMLESILRHQADDAGLLVLTLHEVALARACSSVNEHGHIHSGVEGPDEMGK